MKTILIPFFLMIGLSLSAQNNLPTTPMTGSLTGTENITGAASTKIAPISPAQADQPTVGQTANLGVVTNYGKNNDGSSTGTTVTGNGTKTDAAPVEDIAPSPANRAGTLIATPRRR